MGARAIQATMERAMEMSRLQDAQAKLAAALDRLEAALARPPAPARDLADREQRIAELERELDRISRDHMALEGTVDHVTARLDAAIERLRAMVRS